MTDLVRRPASSSSPGELTTGTQQIAGAKTWLGPQTFQGLITPNGGIAALPGGITPAAGSYGYYQELARSVPMSIPVANSGLIADIDPGCSAWGDANAIGLTLQPGTYDIQGTGLFGPQQGNIVVAGAYVAIGTARQNNGTAIDDIRNRGFFTGLNVASGQYFQCTTPLWRVKPTVPTTYFLKGTVTFSGAATNITIVGNITARQY